MWLKKYLHHFFCVFMTYYNDNLILINNVFCRPSGEIAKWLLSSWALWKKQFMLSLNFTIMTSEKIITSEFPSQDLQFDFSVNVPFKTALQFSYSHQRLK